MMEVCFLIAVSLIVALFTLPTALKHVRQMTIVCYFISFVLLLAGVPLVVLMSLSGTPDAEVCLIGAVCLGFGGLNLYAALKLSRLD